jgi:hypothetical protein
MLLVTFHGGGNDKKKNVQQIYAYQDDADPPVGAPYLTAATPSDTPGNGFRDLEFVPRGSGGEFYLVNSYKQASQVYRIPPGATSVPTPFVNGVGGSGDVLCSVYHPFALAFDDALEVCYLSNQDSNVVVRVGGPASATPGQALDINPSLPAPGEGEQYLPGTFVASQVQLLPDECPDGTPLPPAVKSEDGGLGASPSDLQPDDTPDNSVRGVAVRGTTLYVADEVDNCIRCYDTGAGEYLGTIPDPTQLVQSPTHLLVIPTGNWAHTGQLLITVKPNSDTDPLMLQFNPDPNVLNPLVAVISADALHTDAPRTVGDIRPSGITFRPPNTFYMADRAGQAVYEFGGPDFAPMNKRRPVISGMPDNPEFILYVDDGWLDG